MPHSFMRRRTRPLELVIFDCDGVIVDSEAVANRVVAVELTALGWAMNAEDCYRAFLGLSFTDMVPIIETRIGRQLDVGWKQRLITLVVDAMGHEAIAIPGAVEALHATTAAGIAWRIASNSSHAEMRVKFARLGIQDLVAGRMHSNDDVRRGKPAPDVFLAAAATQGVAPSGCVVIEDSAVGARAAAAAGMDCLGFAPHHDGALLRAEGAVIFDAMAVLTAILLAGRSQP